MEYYVTLFDRNFLPQGLALRESLRAHAGEHVLWVICLDAATRESLDALRDPGVRTVSLDEIETPELLAVKGGRTVAEYCWTLTPFAPKAVFDHEPRAERATYVDADMYFLADPRPLFAELERSGRSVLITEHAYHPDYDRSALYGRFCVQFITFVRGRGEPVRQWWAQRCVEWCFNRAEDGKFGDQKYLDDWPARFSGQVHVLERKSAIQAPWNARRFDAAEAVAWHFHGLRMNGARVRWYEGYRVPLSVEARVYAPYVTRLKAIARGLGQAVFQAPGARRRLSLKPLRHAAIESLVAFARRMRGQ